MSASDFVVTIHAQERMEERFPELAAGKSAMGLATLMHTEINDAIWARRKSTVPPIELSARGVERWESKKQGSYYVWTKDKTRAYLIVEDPEEGMLVLTVICGIERSDAIRERLQKW